MGKRSGAGAVVAARVRYDAANAILEVGFRNGCALAIPAHLIEGLGDRPANPPGEPRLLAGGQTLRWDDLDLDVSVVGLLRFIFGTPSWMRELARTGGSVRSARKAAAARQNGRKGGRPRKAGGSGEGEVPGVSSGSESP